MWDQIAVEFLSVSKSSREYQVYICIALFLQLSRSFALCTNLGLFSLLITKGQEGDPPPIAVS